MTFEPNKWYTSNDKYIEGKPIQLCFIKEQGDTYLFKTTEGREFIINGKEDSLITDLTAVEDKDIPKMGRKFDGEKLRWGLLPVAQVEEVVKVLTFGAKKYAPGNWMYVPGRRWRYLDAAKRHIAAFEKGEKLDKETSIHTLAHAICCLLFLLWVDMNPSDDDMKGY